MAMTWDTVPIGAETGRADLVVTDAMIDGYLASMELDMPCFTTGAPSYDKRIAPPDMVPKLCMTVLFQDYMHREIGPNIRAKQAFTFYAPIPVGTAVQAVGHLVEKVPAARPALRDVRSAVHRCGWQQAGARPAHPARAGRELQDREELAGGG